MPRTKPPIDDLVKRPPRARILRARERALIAGYRAMADENRATAEANMRASVEVLD